ncbi:MAG: RagB/SusD family nutrient uptake outer membrane protein, partial [Balneolaceae bacterium]
MALKSRVLLFLASDLYHVNPASEFVGYGSSERQEFWEEARDAAREVIDLGIYELFNRHSDPVENFTQLFLANEDHEEAIMSRFFPPNIQDNGYQPGLHNGPNGYLNWGGNTPVLSLVNAFEMEDGTDFVWDNPDHAASPFENHDPRFYATILYTGTNTPGPQDDEFYTGRRLDGTWSWTDRGYFLPIPHDELSRNERLVQNPGY